MAMHLNVETEGVPLMEAAEASAPGGRRVGLRRLVPVVAAVLGVMGVAALLLSGQAGGMAQSEAPEDRAVSAVAQANLTEASQLWGQPQNCNECKRMGGSCCVDRPLVCCGQQTFCNLGRCSPLSQRTGNRPYGARPMNGQPGYGQPGYGQPGYGGQTPGARGGWLGSMLGGALQRLNPFNRQQQQGPRPGYGSGGYGGQGGGYGGQQGQQGPTLTERLGGSLLGRLMR